MSIHPDAQTLIISCASSCESLSFVAQVTRFHSPFLLSGFRTMVAVPQVMGWRPSRAWHCAMSSTLCSLAC